ncbi:MAG TPA: ATP-binding protein [Thermoanaerobaculia bacterium]|nr:ATP-binding protein [Thermoanaerobaculia bacterium]
MLAPTGRDGLLSCQVLGAAGLPALACATAAELCREIAAGAGAVVLAEEALQPGTLERLARLLRAQEPWSDLPLIVFASDDARESIEAVEPLGNATLLERPVRLTTLVSAVRAALRARRRQYEVRDLLRRQQETDRRKDEFLAVLGHELRNPLAAIRNALAVLDTLGSPEKVVNRQREVIGRQSRHLARMVDDLLDISRVTLGKITLQRQPVDLREVADACLRELAPEPGRQRVELTAAERPLVVDGDPVRLEQIVSNLLNNALKYTPRDGRIAMSLASEEGQAVVRVRDTGVGVPPEMLPRIFDPFIQVETSLPRAQGGLGLGLPLVRSLADLHGGTVEARSEGPGRGSEFVVRLPLRAEAAVPLRDPRQRWGDGHAAAGGGLRVLVVEDNPDGGESLRDLLELWGHHVELALDGEEGLARALASPPDLALVDIGLPRLDGNELARRLRAQAVGNGIRLVAMSGYGQPEDRRRAVASGFDRYLVKPVNPRLLSLLLEEVRDAKAAVTAGSGASGRAAPAGAG